MDSLQSAVSLAIKEYFVTLDGATACNIYELVITQVEKPLLLAVMQETNHNQSRAAQCLGLSRNTLRKLLAKYDLA